MKLYSNVDNNNIIYTVYIQYIMINTVVMCGIPTNETADETMGQNDSGDLIKVQTNE